MLRRRIFAPLLFLVSSGVAALYLYGQTSPVRRVEGSHARLGADPDGGPARCGGPRGVPAPADRVARSPALPATAAGEARGDGLAAVIVGGVLWTNFLAYHDSSVVPRPRVEELAAIGTRFAHDGPALYDQWDTLPLYFMRQESVAIPSTWAGPAPLAAPHAPVHSTGQPSTPWDVNDLALPYLQGFTPAGPRAFADHVPAARELPAHLPRPLSTTCGGAPRPRRSSRTSR